MNKLVLGKLNQYAEIIKERDDLEKRIYSLERRIEKIEAEGAVIDSVATGRRGKKAVSTVKIKGFPYPEYSKARTSLIIRKEKLVDLNSKLLEVINEVDDYINDLEGSRIRRILRYRYIDSMGWIQVANSVGGNATADSVRMEHDRFFKEK